MAADPPSADVTALGRLARACCVGLLAALVCAAPTVVRARTEGGELHLSLLSAVAVMLCVFIPVAWLAPKAARGWRGVVGQTTPRRLLVGLGLWIFLCAGLFTLLGTFLKSSTHHRGLGGATFGVFAAASAMVVGVLVARATTAGEGRPAWRWPLRVLGAAIVLGGLSVIAFPIVHVEPGADALARASILDALLGTIVITLLLTRDAARAAIERTAMGVAKVVMPVVALAMIVVGGVVIETTQAAAAIRSGGGAVATILGALESWTDRDGDGMGSHFGGRDCDEGDPERHPGASDQPGDGVDFNCDGSDGVAARPEIASAPPSTPPAAPATPEAIDKTVVASAPKPPAKPDIIVVTLDTVRADHTSVYGYARKTTPALEALAEKGIVFEHAYAAGSNTQRALTPVISGRTLSDTPHTNKEWPRLREEANTVAERLKAASYTTGGVSSFTWVRKDRGFAQGFDELDQSAWKDRHPERETTGDLAVEAAIRLYGKMSSGTSPLYLWVHLFDAHDKYVEHPGQSFGKGTMAQYDGEIAFVDQQLARLVSAVERSERSKRTVWIVHGSHGEAFGEHGQTGHGTQLYEESIRVPMILVAPWSKPARFKSDAVSVLDVGATVLDISGASAVATAGVSLRPVLEGGSFERKPVMAFANRRIALIDWPLKLHVFRRKDRRDRLILFNLEQDPQEQTDISGDDKEALVRLDELRRVASDRPKR